MWNKLIKFLKELFKKKKKKKKEPELTSDQFLDKIKKVAKLTTGPVPDRVVVNFEFEKGEYITFEVRNVQEVWMHGKVKKTDGSIGHFHANDALRHRALAVMGTNNAWNLGGNQLRHGEPPMPILPLDKCYSWITANNKTMYEIKDVNVYVIRIVNLLKEELGVTSKMVNVSGVVSVYV